MIKPKIEISLWLITISGETKINLFLYDYNTAPVAPILSIPVPDMLYLTVNKHTVKVLHN